MAHTREQILAHTRHVLTELFELEEDQLQEDALLYDDLDIDSIDTIDLIIELKRFIKRDIDAALFRDARTLGDVVTIIDNLK